MPRTTKEQEVAETFGQQYKLVLADVMLAMERDSCGSDYGGTSWTTKTEADRIGRLLDLAPGDRLLDIGLTENIPQIFAIIVVLVDHHLDECLNIRSIEADRVARRDKEQEKNDAGGKSEFH